MVSQSRLGITTTYQYPSELTAVSSAQAQNSQAVVTTTQTHDAFGRIKSVRTSAVDQTTATNEITEIVYAYQGRQTITTTTRNAVQASRQVQVTDALGRPASIQSADGVLLQYSYAAPTPDTYKITTSRTKGANTQVKTETLNMLGQTIGATGPKPNVTRTYTYDGLGNATVRKTVTPEGEQTRVFTYDTLGRLITRQEPETGTTTFKNHGMYGKPGVIEEIIEIQGPATDSRAGHESSESSESSGNDGQSYKQENGGNPQDEADTAFTFIKRTRTITYDGFGRIKKVTSGDDILDYTYRTMVPLLQQSKRTQTAGIVMQDYYYDGYNRLITEKTTGADGFIANIGYGYDVWGNVNQVSYPGATSNKAGRVIYYQNNPFGQAKKVWNNAQSGVPIAMFGFDALGRRSEIIFGSGATNEYVYGIDRIQQWTVSPLGEAPIANVFSYDNNDYLTSTGEWDITNDSYGRIQQATGHGVRTLHGHDDFGNNIYHQASPSPAPPSSTPPSTMINWEFPPLLNNKIPTETTTGAQTWWQYRNNGEASWIGKTPGGDKIQLDWDGLGLLKAVSDTVGNTVNARHDFTYAPSGLRIRDKRTGTSPHDKRYAYTTGGALMSVYELSPSSTSTITGRRDIVYANGEAIAEIDQNNNIYELHNDYLGSPRYITSGGTGQIAGEQAFGPYGEQMTGTFNGKTLPNGYRPITGYTGHINEDLTGLIYMRGRYYSPKWHRFINSDQGVDPNSINQFAYVNGRPFMATDPSGMATWCMFQTTIISFLIEDHWVEVWRFVVVLYCWEMGDEEAQEERGKDYDDPECERLRNSGVTREGFERLKWEWGQTKTSAFGQEFGSMWIKDSGVPGGFDFVPMTPTFGPKGNPAMALPSYSINDPNGGLMAMSHMHPAAFLPNGVGNNWTPAQYWKSSREDRARANAHQVPSYIGGIDILFVYDYRTDKDTTLMRGDWWDKDCF